MSWNERAKGCWNYALNRNAIHSVWEDTAEARGRYEAVWMLGICGIHDRTMETPPTDLPGKVDLISRFFYGQQTLLDRYATRQWGPVAKCFVP